MSKKVVPRHSSRATSGGAGVPWFHLRTAEIETKLAVRHTEGLEAKAVTERRRQFGLNALPSGPKVSPLKLFLGQFQDMLIIILLVAATASLAISFFETDGSPFESVLIYFIVLAIAVVGFLNEYKAEKTVEALRALMSQTTRVRRAGREVEVPVEELVPGDIVLLAEGQKVPADIRILVANRLQANEASLTGESVSVSKNSDQIITNKAVALGDQRNMLFSGTLVTTGTAEGVVVATGAKTEIGKIARLVSEVADEATPMQRKLDDLGRKLGYVILAICVVVFAVIFFVDKEALTLDLTQRLIFAFTAAVALAVAAIPEGLAFVVRISLTLGARRMAVKKALVRKLSAVESLGSTDVICSDKTGTLTRGEMMVRELYVDETYYELSGVGYDTKGSLTQNGRSAKISADLTQLLTIGALVNNAKLGRSSILGDPTEASLLVSAAKLGIQYQQLQKSTARMHEIPFSSERKMMTTLHLQKGSLLVAVKGATDVVLSHCTKILWDGKVQPLTPSLRRKIRAADAKMASQALRVLGFAYKEIASRPANEAALEKDLIFVGLQGMMDPPRAEVTQVIREVQTHAGIRVIMITGDHIETAKAVAKEIGISGGAVTGEELDAMTDVQLKARAEHIGIFARVNPEHKIRIVRALQHHGHQVAMTGDGVNDAPAIKAADIGIAMGITGTDAAKEASDMILLDDKFVTIVKAVEEGRGIFDNVRKFVNFLLSCNIGEVCVILLGILWHGNLVLTAAQLLFINIVTDGLPAVALGSDPASRRVMKLRPRYYQQAILTGRVWAEIVVFGVLMSIALLGLYTLMLERYGELVAASSVFVAMVVYEFTRLITIRNSYQISWLANPWLMVSIVISIALQLAIVFIAPLADLFKVTQLPTEAWAYTLASAVLLFGIMKVVNLLMSGSTTAQITTKS